MWSGFRDGENWSREISASDYTANLDHLESKPPDSQTYPLCITFAKPVPGSGPQFLSLAVVALGRTLPEFFQVLTLSNSLVLGSNSFLLLLGFCGHLEYKSHYVHAYLQYTWSLYMSRGVHGYSDWWEEITGIWTIPPPEGVLILSRGEAQA